MSNIDYDYREKYACDVCGNVPDDDGMIEHGRGCYTQNEDGGGTSFVEFECECHERDSSFACPLCKSMGIKGHMET